MGSSVLDGRPTPAARIGRFPDCYLRAHCPACGRSTRMHIGLMARRHRLGDRMAFMDVEARLRCVTCGGPGRITEVEGWRR